MTRWLRHPGVALLVDAVLVLVFAAAGRASHVQSSPVLASLTTAWPFLVGTAVGWAVVRLAGRRWPLEPGPGVTVWFATVLVGMLLRRLSGQGTAVAFVLVAAATLAVLLVGWRAVAGWLMRRYAAHPAPRARAGERGAS